MAQPNTQPIFPKTPRIWLPGAALLTAKTAMDGTGTVLTVVTAEATVGSRVDYLKVRAIGTNVATVLRVFINNGSTNATAGNNSLFMERTLAAVTASAVAETADVYIPLDISLPAGYKILCTVGTTVANGVMVTGVGGDYV